MKREVLPEILDGLDSDDPRAIRSRKDLRMINQFMRGEAWIITQLRQLLAEDSSIAKVIELGAGEGLLSQQIKKQFPHVDVTAVDLVEKPEGLDNDVEWVVSDVLKYEGYERGSVVVANLFIHHLQDDQLRQLSTMIQDASAVLFAEPYRAKLPLIMGRCIFPLVNDVTRYDMIVSIGAGFIPGDLPKVLGSGFDWQESFGLIGGFRVRGQRRTAGDSKSEGALV